MSRGTSVGFESAASALLSLQKLCCGHCLVTLSLTINETLKWLSSAARLSQCRRQV